MAQLLLLFLLRLSSDLIPLTGVVGTVDNGAHGQTQGNTELSSCGTSTTWKTKGKWLLRFKMASRLRRVVKSSFKEVNYRESSKSTSNSKDMTSTCASLSISATLKTDSSRLRSRSSIFGYFCLYTIHSQIRRNP